MAFPWSHRDTADMTPAERRRRGRARKNRQEETRRDRSRAARERDRQRLAITIGASLILVILGIVAYGYYQEFYKPPRVWAGNVRNVEFTMGDLVKRIRVIQGLTGQADLTTLPFEYLQHMLNAEVLRQAAPGLGITVTREDIDEAIRAQFYPSTPPGQEVDQGQLDREFQNNYSNFLTRTGLSDQDFRTIVEEQIMARQLWVGLGIGIQEVQQQVEVQWIRLDLNTMGNIVPSEVKRRLEEMRLEDEENFFATVAHEVSAPGGFANSQGYVGWVPRGAFPALDNVLFGNEEAEVEPLEVGGISDPIFTREGTYIIHKLAGPKEEPLSGNMRNKLNDELVNEWYNEQLDRGTREQWIRMNFDSQWYAWVADQVRLTAPRTSQQRR